MIIYAATGKITSNLMFFELLMWIIGCGIVACAIFRDFGLMKLASIMQVKIPKYLNTGDYCIK